MIKILSFVIACLFCAVDIGNAAPAYAGKTVSCIVPKIEKTTLAGAYTAKTHMAKAWKSFFTKRKAEMPPEPAVRISLPLTFRQSTTSSFIIAIAVLIAGLIVPASSVWVRAGLVWGAVITISSVLLARWWEQVTFAGRKRAVEGRTPIWFLTAQIPLFKSLLFSLIGLPLIAGVAELFFRFFTFTLISVVTVFFMPATAALIVSGVLTSLFFVFVRERNGPHLIIKRTISAVVLLLLYIQVNLFAAILAHAIMNMLLFWTERVDCGSPVVRMLTQTISMGKKTVKRIRCWPWIIIGFCAAFYSLYKNTAHEKTTNRYGVPTIVASARRQIPSMPAQRASFGFLALVLFANALRKKITRGLQAGEFDIDVTSLMLRDYALLFERKESVREIEKRLYEMELVRFRTRTTLEIKEGVIPLLQLAQRLGLEEMITELLAEQIIETSREHGFDLDDHQVKMLTWFLQTKSFLNEVKTIDMESDVSYGMLNGYLRRIEMWKILPFTLRMTPVITDDDVMLEKLFSIVKNHYVAANTIIVVRDPHAFAAFTVTHPDHAFFQLSGRQRERFESTCFENQQIFNSEWGIFEKGIAAFDKDLSVVWIDAQTAKEAYEKITRRNIAYQLLLALYPQHVIFLNGRKQTYVQTAQEFRPSRLLKGRFARVRGHQVFDYVYHDISDAKTQQAFAWAAAHDAWHQVAGQDTIQSFFRRLLKAVVAVHEDRYDVINGSAQEAKHVVPKALRRLFAGQMTEQGVLAAA